MSVYDLQDNADMAARFNIDKVPAIVIAAKDDGQITDLGIQYSGIPAGHEFGTLINDIMLVSGRDSGLSTEAREFLKNLDKPLHLQVFVTPTCLHCPRAVLLAHQMAMENPGMIRAEGIEATDFPDLANQFNVRVFRRQSSTQAWAQWLERCLRKICWLRLCSPLTKHVVKIARASNDKEKSSSQK